jgi:isoleucyl-tRNA synthetase
LTIPSKQGKGVLRRVEDVFDCWFESGSMPYAQSHYPFENKEKFENGFPADFIAEGIDQTRGWFYTLLVLGTALFDTAPFKNLICNGLILTKDGQKMSKSMKNYTAPETLIDLHTADAMRLYVLNSPAVRAENLKFVDQGVKDVVRDVLIPLWNTCKLFQQLHGKHLQDGSPIKLTVATSNVMDRWIKSSAAVLVKTVRAEMAAYRLYNVLPAITSFVVDLSNWYVRMNKRRMKGLLGLDEASQSLSTLFSVLYTSVIVIAPFTPFLAENLYQRMRPVLEGDLEDSVHYLMIPEVKEEDFDNDAMRKVSRMQKVIELVRTIRDNSGKTSGKISTKMPVKEVLIIHPSAEFREDILSVQEYIKEETNTLEVNALPSATDYVAFSAQANMQFIGKKYGKEGKAVADAVKKLTEADILQFIATNQVELLGKVLTEEDIKVIRTAKPQAANYELDNDGDLVVLVNKDADENMFILHATREFVNRVQQLRKKLGLTPVDNVIVYYSMKDTFEHLERGLASGLEQVKETLNANVLPLSQIPADAVLIGSAEEVEIRENVITLQLTKA